jgi:hypothetical protein
MPGCSFLEWPFMEKSYRESAHDYKGTSELEKLIIAAHLSQAAGGDNDAG